MIPNYDQINKLSEHELNTLLELIIDSRGLSNTLNLLSNIAVEKAQHIEVSYSDKLSADRWYSDASKIGRTADKLHNGR